MMIRVEGLDIMMVTKLREKDKRKRLTEVEGTQSLLSETSSAITLQEHNIIIESLSDKWFLV
jgi:hypothetical protein